ncbi:uncharacterized protein LOC62_04G006521 [Vanrija pseudolonga]|uniref:Uncharacterized protein n=1 Tax=Vanrija pseudolonga TaxID=143232 RepID=A0AAF0YBQ6_9TREE|nr:hypothetical protein LOC62_04G006521 [Vanrija pseudolonga]
MGNHLSAFRRLGPAPKLSTVAFLTRMSLFPSYRKNQFDELQQAGSALATKHAHTASSYHSFRTVSAVTAAHAWATAAPTPRPALSEYLAHYDVFARLAHLDAEHGTIERARVRGRQRAGLPLPQARGQAPDGDEVARVIAIVYGLDRDTDVVNPSLDPETVYAELQAKLVSALRQPASPAARVAAHAPIASVRSLVSAVVHLAKEASAQGRLVNLCNHATALSSTLAFLAVYEALWRTAIDAAPAQQRQAALCALSRGAVLDVLELDLGPWRAGGCRDAASWAGSVYLRSRASGLLHALGACACADGVDCRHFAPLGRQPSRRKTHRRNASAPL